MDGPYRVAISASCGRLKEMFKSGGYNVYPIGVEPAITEHPDVLIAAVLPVPEPMYQEVGHICNADAGTLYST